MNEDESQSLNENEPIKNKSCVETFLCHYENDSERFLPFPLNLGNFWWNVPKILSFDAADHKNATEHEEKDAEKREHQKENGSGEIFSQNSNITHETNSSILFCTQLPRKNEFSPLNQSQLSPNSHDREMITNVANFYETLAQTDVFNKKMMIVDSEPYHDYFYVAPTNSLCLNETKSYYNATNTTSLEINHWLLENGLKSINTNKRSCFQVAQLKLESESSENFEKTSQENNESVKQSDIEYDISLPSAQDRKERNSKLKCLQNSCDIIPFCALLDRRASYCDYFSSVREICRSEISRGIDTGKRNNRFYHYLRSFSTGLSEKDMRNCANVFNRK